MADETSINFGQIVAVAVIGYLVFRWFTSPTSPSTQGSSRNAAGGRQVSPVHVETVAQMFPQLDRRSIMWDLQRNGGSVPATTERILSGRGLDSPPPSFQPVMPVPATPSSRPSVPAKPTNPDLITRYNLTTKINTPAPVSEAEAPATPSSSSASTGAKPPGWSANKSERAEALKRRREDMVLAARRKMEERDRQKAGAAV